VQDDSFLVFDIIIIG